MSARRIIVHVDRLALRGFGDVDPRAFGAALRDELVRILRTPDAAPRVAALGAVPRVATAAVRVRPGVRPRALAAAVADGVGRAIVK